jgi:hypothetical protein
MPRQLPSVKRTTTVVEPQVSRCTQIVDRSGLPDVNSPSAAIIRKKRAPATSAGSSYASERSPSCGTRIGKGNDSEAEFLAEVADFYAFLVESRNCLGVTPTIRLK